MNELVFGESTGATTAAEESTAWPMVSRPVYVGGLGFGFKWNMGWMHDTLGYMSRDPIHRKYHHNDLTFGLLYAFHENFILPLSHDEVVHGKGSLIGKMPGDRWQRFANLRAYFAFMWTHPGKKLLFMGGEFAQEREWNHDIGLDWQLLGDPLHAGVHSLVRDLNRLYRATAGAAPARLRARRVLLDRRRQRRRERAVLSAPRPRSATSSPSSSCNFTPVPRHDYRIGVPRPGRYRRAHQHRRARSMAAAGSAMPATVRGRAVSDARACPIRCGLQLPPLGVLIFTAET